MNWLHRLRAWIASWFSSVPRAYRRLAVEELPDRLDPCTIYLVGEGEQVWIAAMVCPCGCAEVVQLNLIPPWRPLWRVTRHADQTVSQYPSVWRKKGRRSHFWFRNGRIDWCLGDTPVEIGTREPESRSFDRFA